MATPVGKVKLTIDVPAELKKDFKIHCAVNNIPMTEIIESLIRTYLTNFEQEKGAV